MPRILLGLPETETSILRSIVLGVKNDIARLTGIPENTRVFFPGDINKMAQQGNSQQMGQTIDGTEDVALLNQHGKIFIEVQETPDEDSPQLSAAFRMEYPYLFLDDTLGIYIRPNYRQMELKINFRYRAEDKTAALRWRHEMLSRLDARQEVRLHKLTYNYGVPPEFMYILRELHRVRENKHGYGEDFIKYFTNNCSPSLTEIVNQAGNNGMLVLPETQGRVQGWFDFTDMPEEGSREGDTANWTISFTYTLKYSKPISATMLYPIVVHQQLIDQKYRPNPKTDFPGADERVTNNRSLSNRSIGAFESERDYWRILQADGYAIPYFDEFVPRIVLRDTMRVVTTMVTVDESSPRALFNMKDIQKHVKFSQPIYDFMAEESPYMTQPYNSLFTLDLYEGYERLANGITMDKNLNMVTTFDMDPRKQYHVRLGLVTNLSLLTPDAIKRARENGTATKLIISVIDPRTIINGKFPPILDGDFIKKKDWDKFADGLIGIRDDTTTYQFNCVQFLTIEAAQLTDAMQRGVYDAKRSAS